MASNYSSKYSTYKKYVTSTEVSYASHTSKSSFQKESATEFNSSKGISSSTKELITGCETRTLPVYIAIQDYTPEVTNKDALPLEQGQIVEVLDSKNSAAWLVRTKSKPPVTGWVPGSYFETPTEYYKHRKSTREIANGELQLSKQEEALEKRDEVFQELLKTEEEFVALLKHVIDNYVVVLDEPSTPTNLRFLREQLFLNIRDLYNFHANVLLKGLQYYSDDPGKLGQTFVRLERDFDHHVRYCRDYPEAVKLLDDPKTKDYIEKIISDVEKEGKTIADYLKLPISRLQSYSQYIKEMVKYSARAEVDTKSLQKALELILSIPQRANDLAFIRNIQDYPGDTVKLGRLIRHDMLKVWEEGSADEAKEVYVFLFRNKIVATVRKEPEDPDDLPEFYHLHTTKLEKYDIFDHGDDIIALQPRDRSQKTIYLQSLDSSNAEFVKQIWTKDIVESKESVHLSDARSEFSECSTHSRKSSLALGEDGAPPRKSPRLVKSPPQISPSGSSQSLYSSTTMDLTAGASGNLEMQGTRITKTQYGFRTLQESSAKMCLKVTGYPLPIITWFKDGEQLHEDSRHSFYADDEGFFAMTIDPVLVEDTGRYTCVATNEYGQATTSAFFRVVKVEHEPSSPKFVKCLEDQTVQEGSSVQLQCDVEGWPEPEVMWLLDGQLIHPSHDFRIEYDGQHASLEIKDAQPEDSGIYCVKISNERGTKESQAVITVEEDPEKQKVAPEFQQRIQDTVVDEGSTVRFKAVCTGDPIPEVQWLINGVLLTPSDNVNFLAEDGIYILTISNVTKHFDGDVQCRAANRLGDASCNARLSVNTMGEAPPLFQQQLSDQSAKPGEAAMFEVYVESGKMVKVSWFMNDTEVTKNTPNVTLINKPDKGCYQMVIEQVVESMSGIITCIAENESGRTKSFAKLLVPRKTSLTQVKPEFTTQLRSVAVDEGETVKFKVLCSGDPEPVAQWFINGVPLTASKNVSCIAEDGVYILTLENVTKDFSGEVRCVVMNVAGEDSTSATLTVNARKGKREAEQPSEEAPGDKRLATAPPAAAAEDSMEELKQEKVEQILREQVITDQGQVKPSEDAAPKFLEKLATTSAIEGDTVRFQVQVAPASGVKLLWYCDGSPLEESDDRVSIAAKPDGTHLLTIKNVTRQLDGEISCTARNSAGEVNCSAKLTVAPAPKKGSAPVVTKGLIDQKVTEGDDVQFQVQVQSDQRPAAKWFIGPMELKSSPNVRIVSKPDLGTFSLELRDTTEDQAGLVTCKVENEFGTTESLATLDVKPKGNEPRLVKPLTDKEVSAGDFLKFEVGVQTESGSPKVTWSINDTVVKETSEIIMISKPRAGIYTLEVDRVKPDMAGTVTCSVKNEFGEATSTAKLAVVPKTGAPVLKQELTDQKAKPGEKVRFEVKVQSDEPTTLSWSLNDKELWENSQVKIISRSITGAFSLELDKLTPEMAGTVTAVARNSAGEIRSTAKLEISGEGLLRRHGPTKPEFKSRLSPIDLAEGETLRAQATIVGDPEPKVKWYINNRIVVETEDVKMTTQNGVYSLEIEGASEEMTGDIKCVAFNKMGETSCSAPLTVERRIPVEFEQVLGDTTCYEGDTLRLRAVLLGEPAPDVSWYINRRKLVESENIQIFKDASAYVVVIKNITTDYSGEVLCRAVNEFGEASSSAQLIVLSRGVPPDFTEWLSNVTAKDGSSVKMHVVFTGDPIPTISWFLNDQELVSDDNIEIRTTSDNRSTLIIKKFSKELIGEIMCRAENDAGEVSCTAQLQIGTRVEIDVSEHSELEAVAMSMDESEEGAGTDMSIADEEIPMDDSRTGTPMMAPKFLTRIKDVKAKKGKKAIFECLVPESKGIVVKWLKDGREIELIARIRVISKPQGTGATEHQLVIEDLELPDAGTYTCVISNEAGSELCSAKLVVEDISVGNESAPEFIRKVTSVTVNEGEVAKLECKIAGEPQPAVRWFQERTEIKQSQNTKIEGEADGTQRLIIKETTTSRSGEYRCEISNVIGTASSTGSLEVKEAKETEAKPSKEAPAFTRQLQPQQVAMGVKTVMECAVTVSSKAIVNWFKDGADLYPDRNKTIESFPDGTQRLTIKESRKEDSGRYSCEATNIYGSAKTEASLTVKSEADKEREPPPAFTSGLKSKSVKKGDYVTLECSVSNAKIQVRWLKDGQEIHPDDCVSIESNDDGTQRLTINDAEEKHIGRYSCEIKNSAGLTRTEAALDVKFAAEREESLDKTGAPQFTVVLKHDTVNESNAAVLECKLIGEPFPEVKWFKNGKPIEQDLLVRRHIECLDDGTQRIFIEKAELVDAGLYKCEATNILGYAATEATLKVADRMVMRDTHEDAPEFLTQLKPTTVDEGEQAVMDCVLSTATKAIVHWYQDGKEVLPSHAVKIDSKEDGTQRLLIKQTSEEHTGMYSCEAITKGGKASTDAPLKLNVPEQAALEEMEVVPEFVVPLKPTSVKQGEHALMECVVFSTTAVQINWYKNGVPLKQDQSVRLQSRPDGTQRLEIKNARLDDAGDYTCEATNKAGWAKIEASLDVQYAEVKPMEEPMELPPEFSSPLKPVNVTEGKQAVFECVASSATNVQVHWYKDGKQLRPGRALNMESLGDGTQRLVISETFQEHVGNYSCEVVNSTGTANTEAPLTVQFVEQQETKSSSETAPEFVETLNEETVKVGQQAVLECKVTGGPKPEVKWFKNDRPLSADAMHKLMSFSDGTQRLIIQKAEIMDVGLYRCEAVNVVGTAKTVGELKVAEERDVEQAVMERVPDFTYALRPLTVEEGQEAVLKCAVASASRPEVHWFKDGKELQPEGDVVIESYPDGTQKLIILHAHVEDVGKYTCEATNKAGKATTKAFLDVKQAKIQEIKAAQETAPEFTVQLKQDVVKEGQSVVLECKVFGSPKPDVKWFKDDRKVLPDPTHVIESLADGTQRLSIQKAVVSDVGEYRCEAVNVAGRATTEAHLKVADERMLRDTENVVPFFTTQLKPVTVVEGQEAVFECAVASGSKPAVLWYKDGKQLVPSAPMIMESLPDGTQRLKIQNAHVEDIGRYTCEAVTKAGKAETRAPLDVKVADQILVKCADDESAPEFSSPLKPVFVDEGREAVLECAIPAGSLLEVHWFKNGKEITPDRSLAIDSLSDGTQRLVISHATTKDVGEYSCQAVAPTTGQAATTEAGLKVQGALERFEQDRSEKVPEFLEELRPQKAQEGEFVALECKVAGPPMPKVAWFKDNQPLSPSGHLQIESTPDGTQRLTIQKATTEDVGTYRCEATNKAGKAKTAAPLEVQEGLDMMYEVSESSVLETVWDNSMSAAGATIDISILPDKVLLNSAEVSYPIPEAQVLRVHEKAPSTKPCAERPLTVYAAGICENESEVCCWDATLEKPEGSDITEAIVCNFRIDDGSSIVSHSSASPRHSTFVEPEAEAAAFTILSTETNFNGIHQLEKDLPDVLVSPYKRSESLATDDTEWELLISGDSNFDFTSESSTTPSSSMMESTWRHIEPGQINVDLSKQLIHNESPTQFLEESVASLDSLSLERCEMVVPIAASIASLKPIQNTDQYPHDELYNPKHAHVFEKLMPVDLPRLLESSVEPISAGRHSPQLLLNVHGVSKTERYETAPEFLRELEQCNVEAGETIALECQVAAGSSPEIKWFKDDQQVTPSGHMLIESLPDGTQKLVIHKATAEDQGTYRCEVTNVAGSKSSKAPLTVHMPEEMEIEVQDEDFADEMDVGERPAMDFAAKPGEVADDTEELVQKAKGTKPPKFTRMLENLQVDEKDSIQLTCAVTGEPFPEVRWYKGGLQVEAKDRHVQINVSVHGVCTLQIASAAPEDADHYTCTIKNQLGSAESCCEVTVKSKAPGEAPRFVRGLEDRTATVGEKLVLEVETSTKDVIISWLKNGSPVKPSANVNLEDLDSNVHRLTISSVSMSDEARFSCEIGNDLGTATTSGKLSVQEVKRERIAPSIKKGLSDVAVKEKSAIRLEIEVEGGKPKSVKWYKADKELRANGRIKIEQIDDHRYQLVIAEASPEDQGQYSVTADNEFGSAESKANASVEALPKDELVQIVMGLKDTTVHPGEATVLEAQIAGGKPKIVKWFKNGRELVSSKRVRPEKHTEDIYRLILDETEPGDAADYKVVFENDAGAADSGANLTMISPAEESEPVGEEELSLSFTRKLQDQRAKPGTKIVLEAEVNSKPKSVKWFKAGKEVRATEYIKIEKVDDVLYRLVIESCAKDDEAEYKIEVSNDKGTVSSSASVLVEKVAAEALAFVRGLKDTTVDAGDAVSFEVETNAKPTSVVWSRNGQELSASSSLFIEQKSDNVFCFKIPEAKEDAEGEYQVRVSNDAGDVAESAASITVRPASPSAKKPKQEELNLSFTRKLQNQSVKQGDTLKLEAEVNVEPKAVKWAKNGKEIQASDRIKIEKIGGTVLRLIIREASKSEDRAEYSVTVVNDLGSATSTADVSVTGEAPKFVTPLQDKTVPAGSKVVLEAEISGKPKQVKWYRNGKEVSASAKINLAYPEDNIYQLIIPEADLQADGIYKIVAENDFGSDSSEAKLTITEPAKQPQVQAPRITRALEDKQVDEGGKVSMVTEVEGVPKSVKWFKNGKEISASSKIKIEQTDDHTFKLTIFDAAADDEADYKIVVANDAGSDDSSASLTVKLAPEEAKKAEPEDDLYLSFTRKVQDQTVKEDSPIVLEAQTNQPAKDVAWYQNGKEVKASERIKIEVVDKTLYRLTIARCSVQQDDGEYRIEVSNNRGSASSSGKVNVVGQAPRFVKPLHDKSVPTGSKVALEVQVDGKPKQVKWYKNGKEVKTDAKITLVNPDNNIYQLIIPQADKTFEGCYRVEISNDYGSDSSEARLTITEPTKEEKRQKLRISNGLQNKRVEVGAKVFLSVEVDGVVETVKWFKNGQEIPAGAKSKPEKVDDKTYKLTIPDASMDDEADYKIIVANDAGSDESSASLTVVQKAAEEKKAEEELMLSFTRKLQDQRVDKGSTVILEAATNAPPKSVKWYKANEEVKVSEKISIEKVNETTFRLTILSAEKSEQEAEYRLEVGNSKGTITSTANVTVLGARPRFVTPLHDKTAPAGTKVVLEVEVEGKPKQVKWYRNGKELKTDAKITLAHPDDNIYQLIIPSAAKDLEGSYKVEISNDYGSDSSEAKLTVTEPVKEAKGQALKVLKALVDSEVDCGANVSFTAEIDGSPKTVKWFKNGQELKPSVRAKIEKVDDKTYKLTIPSCEVSNEGSYKIVASNDFGCCDSEASLTVKLVPRIIEFLKDQTIPIDSTLTLACKIEGHPFPEIAWLKDGVEVENSDRATISTSADGRCQLRIKDVKAEDAGTYICIAQNRYGSDRTQCAIKVEDLGPGSGAARRPPEFVKSLGDQTVPEGDDLVLEVRVVGEPMLDIAWFKDDVELKTSPRVSGRMECVGDEVTFRLTIKGVAADKDAGLYKCVASNVHGTASTQGRSTVEAKKGEPLGPPKFVIPLRDTSAVEGTALQFDIKVRGQPVPNLKWFKDGEPLQVGGRVQLEDMCDNRWRLTISDTQPADAGNLKCVAENQYGFDQCMCEVVIKPPKDRKKGEEENFAPRFNVPLHDRSLPEHSQMSIECHCYAKPIADIKWFKDGEELADSPKIETKNTFDGKCRLVIKDFCQNDEGVYKCQATNELGKATTQATLRVELFKEDEVPEQKGHAPRFVKVALDQTVKEGVTVTFENKVDALPFADIRWFKDGVPLLPRAKVSIETLPDGTCRLIIADASAADAGAYRCLASNKYGTCNAGVTLNVQAAKPEKKKDGELPQFVETLRDTRVDASQPTQLRCRVTGLPRPDIKWYKDGVLLRENPPRISFSYGEDGVCCLLLPEVKQSDEGLYRCVAENSLGSATTMGNLSVELPREKKKLDIPEGEAPRFVIGLEDCSCVEGTNVELECRVTGQPTPVLKWYKDGALLVAGRGISIDKLPDNRYKLSISNTAMSHEGVYRCVATNDFGTASTKAQLTVTSGAPRAMVPAAVGTAAPRCVVPLSDQRASEGNPLRLECKFAGNPLPEVEWLKDGEKVKPSDRIKLDSLPDGTCRLVINNATPDDEGVYRCVARSSLGTANSKANVVVRPSYSAPLGRSVSAFDITRNRAPEFVVPLQSQATREGFSITLTSKVTGDPTATLKWFKDGEKFYPGGRGEYKYLPDGNIELTLNNIKPGDAGCYRCVAENDYGTANTRCEITVEGKLPKNLKKDLLSDLGKGKAPGFLKPLTVCRVAEGAKAVFQCLPFGEPFPQIKWLKDGMEVAGSERVTIDALPDGTQQLTIEDVLPGDEGFYRCVATNDFGTTSTKAECIVEVDKLRKCRSGILREPPEEAEKEPPQEKPRFRRGLRNITAPPGTAVQFECSIVGNPKPSVKWFKNGQELLPSDKVLFWGPDDHGTIRLVILNAQPDDEADYRCEISNPLGSAQSEAALSILKEKLMKSASQPDLSTRLREYRPIETFDTRPTAPGFMKQLRNKHAFAGTPAIFDCVVCGFPEPEVEWFHNGQRLEPNDRIRIQRAGGRSHALVIFDCKPEDAGEYYCKAINSNGTASSAAILDVTVPFDKMFLDHPRAMPDLYSSEYDFRKVSYVGVPTPPNRGPFVADVTGHYLTLSWIPTLREPPRYPQVTYVVEMKELPHKEWVMIDYNIAQPCCKVRNLELGKSYQFRVRAENIYGISEPSPASPPSQLMARPKPVLDRKKKPIPILDPYTLQAMERTYGEKYAAAPWFAPIESDRIYCADHDTLEIAFFVHGFPDPQTKWLFRGAELNTDEPGSRYHSSLLHGSDCVLVIKDFGKRDVGQYFCQAVNNYGEATQGVFVEVAELPRFLQPLENKTIRNENVLRLECGVEGTPFPDIKWLKDWRPIAESMRVKIQHQDPHHCSLVIYDPIASDSGVYTCTAINPAGKVSTSATVSVQPENRDFRFAIDVPRKKLRSEKAEHETKDEKPMMNGGDFKDTLQPRKVREFYRIEEEPEP